MGVNLSTNVGAALTKVTEAVSPPKTTPTPTPTESAPAASPAKAPANDGFAAATKTQEQWSAAFASVSPGLSGAPLAKTEAKAEGKPKLELSDAAKLGQQIKSASMNTALTSFVSSKTETSAKAVLAGLKANGKLEIKDTGKLELKDTVAAASSEKLSRTLMKIVSGPAMKILGNVANQQRNVVSQDKREKAGWKDDASVVKQSTDTNCGAAAVAMLASSKKGEAQTAEQQTQKMNELSAKYASTEGTTPKQLTKMLAHEGFNVTRGSARLDRNALNATLENGGKGVAMVDSNLINPKAEGKGEGGAHWVVIDGMDKDNNYLVKDPASGTSYFVKPEELEKAMGAVRSRHNSGGILFVENPVTPRTETELAQQGAQQVAELGDEPGKGSNSRRGGRDSS